MISLESSFSASSVFTSGAFSGVFGVSEGGETVLRFSFEFSFGFENVSGFD